MNSRRWLALILGLLIVGGVVASYALPEVVRRVAVARIHAISRRPVTIDRVGVNVLTGRLAVHGLRLAERDGQSPFAEVERLDVHLRMASLLRGRLRFHEIGVIGSTVRVVRLSADTFNFTDLVTGSGPATGGVIDVTVDRFVVTRGKVTLEDRALPEPRTWSSEHIEIDARDLSTRQGGGRAVARSVTAGAPVAIELADVRLHPIHLRATVTTEGFDLALARLYLPPDASVVPERGRVTTSVTAVLDAREGLRADATGRFEDVALSKPDGSQALALVPKLTTRISGFAFGEGGLRLDQLAIEGAMSVRDPTAKQGKHFQLGSVRGSIADLTWPATTPGRLDLTTSIPGGGTLAVTGTVRPPPDATQLRVRLARVDLASWAQFLPIAARITGVAEADLSMNEPLAAGIPAGVQGSIAVSRIGVADARGEILGARRVEASGLALHWPTRLVVKRVLVSDPRGVVERDRSGGFPLNDLASRSTSPSASTPGPVTGAAPSFGVDVGELVVKNGALAWRDATVSPPARLDVSALDATVTGIGWPLRGPARLRVDLRPPGGGQLQLAGRVEFEPVSADVRVVTRNAELAPYRPYLPTTALVAGAADVDAAVVLPSLADGRARVRGRAALSRVDVRDGERTVMRLDRATATGIDVDWPERVTVDRLALAQPWVLVERDDKGGFALRSLLTQRASTDRGSATAGESSPSAVAVTVAHLSVAGGGMRIVDQSVSPPFAVDLQSTSVTADGLSTAAAKPARLELTGRLGPGAELALRGTVGALGGPLRLDVNGELREFALPRTNPYLLQQVGWKTTEGRLTSKLEIRVDGDALSARTDIRLSRMQLVRAGAEDNAQTRLGLPLGVITSLMKDSRGDINLSLPVGGRLSDPRFDFSEAIWGAVRAVAIKAITLPVSWIGRVRFSPDSRIERIEVDPVTFEPGTSTLTAEGRAQVTRLTAFLDQLPEVRMSLTPVVSSRDLSDDQRPPVDPADLAAQRVKTVRTTLERGGIDVARLPETPLVQRDGADGQVNANVLEPETPRPSKMRDVLRRLGMPLKGDAE